MDYPRCLIFKSFYLFDYLYSKYKKGDAEENCEFIIESL